eukprot:341815-Hanusia_phi.AAC.3
MTQKLSPHQVGGWVGGGPWGYVTTRGGKAKYVVGSLAKQSVEGPGGSCCSGRVVGLQEGTGTVGSLPCRKIIPAKQPLQRSSLSASGGNDGSGKGTVVQFAGRIL